MVLVLFILGIILLFISIILLSDIRINIKKIEIENIKVNKKLQLYFQVYFLNKIKIFSKKINTDKLTKLHKKNSFKIIKNNNIKFDKETIKILLKIKPKIEMLNLYIDLGYEEADVISCLVGVLNSIISVVLPCFSKNRDKIKYSVKPIYNQNILYVYLDSIISVKIVHIIYVILKLIKKGSMKNERTSNRRVNAVQP